MRDKFIVNACLTGMVARKSHSAEVPMSPGEIAADVAACIDRGASVVHLHARDQDEEPEWRTEAYQRIVEAVRDVSEDVVLCVSTSGRKEQAIECRTACLRTDPPPDMASLTLGSINFKNEGVLNSPATILQLADAMAEQGVRPELEIFDIGMARAAARLVSEGIVEKPGYANILLGNLGTADLSLADLAAITCHLPPEMVWAVAGIGKTQAQANALGIMFGHGVRVGLEDNLFLGPEKRPASNPELVERTVQMGRLLGKEPTSIAETRELLDL